MKVDADPKTYFWAYDIFGYLFPGVVVLAGYVLANGWVRAAVHPHLARGGFGVWAVCGLLAYVLGHVVSALSSWVLEKLLISRFLGYPTSHMFSNGRSGIRELLLPSYFRAYSEGFQERVKVLFRARFGMQRFDNHDLFWLAWSYVCLHHPVGYRRATHFLDLYGFSRNLCMGLLVVMIAPILPAWTSILPWHTWFVGAIGAALLMFVNYTKLLRRLNDEVYRAFVASAARDDRMENG